jgi:hypothetical protein
MGNTQKVHCNITAATQRAGVCYLEFLYNSRVCEIEIGFINAELMQIESLPHFTPFPS